MNIKNKQFAWGMAALVVVLICAGIVALTVAFFIMEIAVVDTKFVAMGVSSLVVAFVSADIAAKKLSAAVR